MRIIFPPTIHRHTYAEVSLECMQRDENEEKRKKKAYESIAKHNRNKLHLYQ